MNNHKALRVVKLLEMGDGIDITMLPLPTTTLKLIGLKEGEELDFHPVVDQEGNFSHISLYRTAPKDNG